MSLSDQFNSAKHVTVHALHTGSLTLPAAQFLAPCEPGLRLTKPCLSFLIQHTDRNHKTTRILFDLGIRKDPAAYPLALQAHLRTREPLSSRPDVLESLQKGGLSAGDIDIVMLSHVHWDHVGTPSDFPSSTFVVGNGSLQLLRSGATTGSSAKGGHSHFEPDLLPAHRTIELPAAVAQKHETAPSIIEARSIKTRLPHLKWQRLLHFQAAIDIFGDESVFIIDAPGHLDGHINVFARVGPERWVYLAGDACHDRRLLTGERKIAEWADAHGATCCIHSDRLEAEKTLRSVRVLQNEHGQMIEVILAHDADWGGKAANEEKFWPGSI